MSIVYAYKRFSKKIQRKGRSDARQTERADAYCKRHGHTLDTSLGPLFDDGVSGFHLKNMKEGALGRFVTEVKAGTIRPGARLLIENVDRFSRGEVKHSLKLFLDLIHAGIIVVIIREDEDTGEDTEEELSLDHLDMNRLNYVVGELSRSHRESKRKSKLSKDHWNDKRAKARATGRPLSAGCPAWLCLDKATRTWVEIPERVATLKRIFVLSSEGNGAGFVCKILNDEKVPTFGKSPNWSTTTVRTYQRDRRAIGEFQPYILVDGKTRVPDGDPVVCYFPTVIDETTFYSVQGKVEERKKTTKGRNSDKAGKVVNLFTGLLKDSRDGSPMHSINYNNRRKLVSQSCQSKAMPWQSIDYSSFEEAFLVYCQDHLKPGDFEVAPDEHRSKIEELSGRIASVNLTVSGIDAEISGGKIKNIGEAIQLRDVLITNRNALLQEIEAVRAAQVNHVTEAASELKTVAHLIAQADPEERERLRDRVKGRIAMLVKEIPVMVAYRKPLNVRLIYVSVDFKNSTFVDYSYVIPLNGGNRKAKKLGKEAAPYYDGRILLLADTLDPEEHEVWLKVSKRDKDLLTGVPD